MFEENNKMGNRLNICGYGFMSVICRLESLQNVAIKHVMKK